MKKRKLLALCPLLPIMFSISSCNVEKNHTHVFDENNTCKCGYVSEGFTKHTYDNDGYILNYRKYMPEDASEDNKRPLIIFLHGVGERGDDNEAQLRVAINNIYNKGEWAKSVIIAPQCPLDAYWVHTPWADGNYNQSEVPESKPLGAVIGLVKEYMSKPYIDISRIYVVGLSLGGFGTWDLISRYPDIFAAAVPVCGGGPVDRIEALKNIPIYTFHGTVDDAVPYAATSEMYKLIKDAGGEKIIFKTFIDGHIIWDRAFAFEGEEILGYPPLEEWLFSQRKEN